MPAIDLRRNRAFAKAGGNRRRHLGSGNASRKLAHRRVGKSQGNLGHGPDPRLFGAYKAPGCGL